MKPRWVKPTTFLTLQCKIKRKDKNYLQCTCNRVEHQNEINRKLPTIDLQKP